TGDSEVRVAVGSTWVYVGTEGKLYGVQLASIPDPNFAKPSFDELSNLPGANGGLVSVLKASAPNAYAYAGGNGMVYQLNTVSHTVTATFNWDKASGQQNMGETRLMLSPDQTALYAGPRRCVRRPNASTVP